MLKLILPLMMTLLSSKWSSSMMTLTVLIMINISALSQTGSMTLLNEFMMSDNMSSFLVLLSLWMSMLMLNSSNKSIYLSNTNKMFSFMVIALLLLLMISFMVNNILMFYVTFEASLIPTLMLILMWGYQPERLQASMYLMLYTVSASLPLLLSIMYFSQNTKSLLLLTPNKMPLPNILLSTSMMLAFLVKMPMYLTHLWLPKAHVEAPVAGSMVLASILLKLGTYGMMRTMHMWSNYMSINNIIFSISAWGAISTSIICIRQPDMKSLIAYSSVSHMALIIMGLATMTEWGWMGSMTMMLAHGLSSSGLFAMANMNYEAANSRSIMLSKGLMTISPIMSTSWFLLSTANMAAPPSMNLMAEIILTMSIVSFSTTSMLILSIMMMFTAAYSLGLYTTITHGSMNSTTNFSTWPNSNNMVNILHITPTLTLFLLLPMITST
uniref:NADH dehydrogenase subunit 4 n=1 Tax=Ramisyllis kingghidorahi TaxID=2876589 RepID=UPI002176C83A|nr:NADH dehydrogenase subunit 4 [Ramisyllis kingghidorahi]UUF68150.1 NADH dehydrogenase subunit 4 [Ramisyllis kingghidorahi]